MKIVTRKELRNMKEVTITNEFVLKQADLWAKRRGKGSTDWAWLHALLRVMTFQVSSNDPYTTCLVRSEGGVPLGLGVAVRCPKDPQDMKVGATIAIWRALDNFSANTNTQR